MNIEKVLNQCRFSKRYRGHRELEECIRIVVEDEDNLLYLTGIYQKTADKYHVSLGNIERNIRTIVDYSWGHGGKEQLELLTGAKYYDKPTVGEIIEILACYVIEQEKLKKNV